MLTFLIAPDFSPVHFSGWHMFNTLLQRRTGRHVRLLMPADGLEEAELKSERLPDLVYANPFDATELVREHGYLPLVRPAEQSDEVVIATHTGSPYHHSDELPENCRILLTANHDVRLIGLRLLESANLTAENVSWLDAAAFQAAARRLIGREADAAFFLASAYDAFNDSTKQKMRVLMRSRLDDLYHVVLLHPDCAELYEPLLATFLAMHSVLDPAGRLVLSDLGLPLGFEKLEQEDVEYMFDLLDTLTD